MIACCSEVQLFQKNSVDTRKIPDFPQKYFVEFFQNTMDFVILYIAKCVPLSFHG